MVLLAYISIVLLSLGFVDSENATFVDDTCPLEPWQPGPWSALLEEWATLEPVYSERHGRIMALPPTKGYYVTERIDGPLTPPPPPPPQGSPDSRGPPARPLPPGPPRPGGPSMPLGPPLGSQPPSPPPPGPPPGPLRTPLAPHNYNEWSPPSSGGKIVNRPSSYDTFRPSYPPPMPGYRPPRPAADRIDEPPRKQVSETDLYLLGAIEKLVYRVDLMEKRLRRMEENMHYLVAGTDTKPDPCPSNFSRTGSGCFHWSSEALDWKGANLACRKLKAALLELPEPTSRRQLVSAILADKERRGNDYWTGGLNPGLLWIWAHSARPVEANSTGSNGSSGSSGSKIAGDGRCLALVHDAPAGAYVYRGRDCALRHRFVCQKEEDRDKIANEIERAARNLKSQEKRKPKILWANDAV